MSLRSLIELLLRATDVVQHLGYALRRVVVQFVTGVILHLLAAAFLLAAVLVLATAALLGLGRAIGWPAALGLIGLALLVLALIAWLVGRANLENQRRR